MRECLPADLYHLIESQCESQQAGHASEEGGSDVTQAVVGVVGSTNEACMWLEVSEFGKSRRQVITQTLLTALQVDSGGGARDCVVAASVSGAGARRAGSHVTGDDAAIADTRVTHSLTCVHTRNKRPRAEKQQQPEQRLRMAEEWASRGSHDCVEKSLPKFEWAVVKQEDGRTPTTAAAAAAAIVVRRLRYILQRERDQW